MATALMRRFISSNQQKETTAMPAFTLRNRTQVPDLIFKHITLVCHLMANSYPLC
jgi:hypothetical protein